MPERTRTITLVLDNEAVQELIDAAHPKHRRVMTQIESVAGQVIVRTNRSTDGGASIVGRHRHLGVDRRGR